MSIESLLTTKVIEAVKQCYDADVDKDKVQLQATRKEFAGDLTVVVFSGRDGERIGGLPETTH